MLSSGILILLLSTLALALLLHIYLTFSPQSSLQSHLSRRPRTAPAHLLTVLGSGGHTAEMLSMLSTLDPQRYTHRTWVVSSGDDFSAARAEEFERTLHSHGDARAPARAPEKVATRAQNGSPNGALDGKEAAHAEEMRRVSEHRVGDYAIYTLPRARQIHQSLLTTPLSCLRCLYACLRLLLLLDRQAGGVPDLVVTNGPATALIMLLAVRMLRPFLWARRRVQGRGGDSGGDRGGSERGMRTMYVESWARVRTPSLSLKIIGWVGLCDRVLVQHRQLEEKGWGEWRGDLIR